MLTVNTSPFWFKFKHSGRCIIIATHTSGALLEIYHHIFWAYAKNVSENNEYGSLSYLVTWWLQDHHRWSLQVVSQEGSSSAVHHNHEGSRASPVHIILWSLATWSEQPYALRQKQTNMIRKINKSSKIYVQDPDYFYKTDIHGETLKSTYQSQCTSSPLHPFLQSWHLAPSLS